MLISAYCYIERYISRYLLIATIEMNWHIAERLQALKKTVCHGHGVLVFLMMGVTVHIVRFLSILSTNEMNFARTTFAIWLVTTLSSRTIKATFRDLSWFISPIPHSPSPPPPLPSHPLIYLLNSIVFPLHINFPIFIINRAERSMKNEIHISMTILNCYTSHNVV